MMFSWSKVTFVEVIGDLGRGHIGQGQPKTQDIGMWAHANVKLLHLIFTFPDTQEVH